jgi:hypothetical protein
MVEIKNLSVFWLPGFRVDREIVTSGNRKSRNPELNQDRPSVETRGDDQESIGISHVGISGFKRTGCRSFHHLISRNREMIEDRPS